MTTTYNPGEPLFDRETGQVVIDPETGDVVTCSAGAVFVDQVTGERRDADDVANAAWYRITARLGEARRNRQIGLDYVHDVFDARAGLDVALGAVADVALTTPGVQSLNGPARVVSYSRRSRQLVVALGLRKRDETLSTVTGTIGA